MSLTIRLSWPLPELSPNARLLSNASGPIVRSAGASLYGASPTHTSLIARRLRGTALRAGHRAPRRWAIAPPRDRTLARTELAPFVPDRLASSNSELTATFIALPGVLVAGIAEFSRYLRRTDKEGALALATGARPLLSVLTPLGFRTDTAASLPPDTRIPALHWLVADLAIRHAHANWRDRVKGESEERRFPVHAEVSNVGFDDLRIILPDYAGCRIEHRLQDVVNIGPLPGLSNEHDAHAEPTLIVGLAGKAAQRLLDRPAERFTIGGVAGRVVGFTAAPNAGTLARNWIDVKPADGNQARRCKPSRPSEKVGGSCEVIHVSTIPRHAGLLVDDDSKHLKLAAPEMRYEKGERFVEITLS